MIKGPTMLMAEERYLHYMPFHVQVDTAVKTIELESMIRLDPDDKSLATLAAAVALFQNGAY
jgi:hypothetical protein